MILTHDIPTAKIIIFTNTAIILSARIETTRLTFPHPYGVPSHPRVGADPRIYPFDAIAFFYWADTWVRPYTAAGMFRQAQQPHDNPTTPPCRAVTPWQPQHAPLNQKGDPQKNEGRLALIVLAVIQQPNKGDYCSIILHGPVRGDAAVARGPQACVGGLDERATFGHITQPARSVVTHSKSSEACDAAQTGAIAEHRIIATFN